MLPPRFSVRRRNCVMLVTLLTVGTFGSMPLLAQDAWDAGIDWEIGPTTSKLGMVAEVEVPEGYKFAGTRDTQTLMERMGNIVSGDELGFLTPENDAEDWFIVFEFDECGYVKDEEGADLDADAILDSIKRGTAAANKQRRERGWPEMTIVGWEIEPRYDAKSNNLVWAPLAESEGTEIVNYNTRLLGRRGVMEVALVIDPEDLQGVLGEFETLMSGYAFSEGNRYAEFRVGDRIAEYGLTALITGGAAAVALKSGLFKWLWKAIVGVVILIGGAFKAIFRGGKSASE